MLLSLVVGLFAGYLAGQIMNGSGYGILMDLCLGLGGGIVGSFVFGLVGLGPTGLIGSLIAATFGAVLLVWIARQVRSRRDSF